MPSAYVPMNIYVTAEEMNRYLDAFYTKLGHADAVERDDRFPHECPRCSAPAYVGFTEVDCSARCVAG